jgi:hypothetical protein
MNYFKIAFIDFRDFVDQRLVDENEQNTPVSYYEDDSTFFIFKPKDGIIYWTEVSKDILIEEDQKVENFKLEFLSKAVALIELPFQYIKI